MAATSLVAVVIKKQVAEEADPQQASSRHRATHSSRDPMEHLASRVASKQEDRDFGGAVRLACSKDTIAPMNDSTYSALQQKHPAPHPDSDIQPLAEDHENLARETTVTVEEVAKAIRSFPNGSAGGLKPQHLKDLTGPSAGSSGHGLLSALAAFLTVVIRGKTPPSIRPYFFAANLIALEKTEGGVRPIAVGCTLRRLAAKVMSGKVVEDMASLLAPRQLGYGIKRGAEAAGELGLLLYHCKSEVICGEHPTADTILSSVPGARMVDPALACLLGSPIGGIPSISRAIDEKWSRNDEIGTPFCPQSREQGWWTQRREGGMRSARH